MIKAVLLDVDNTLLDFHACAEASMNCALEENQLSHQDGLFSAFLRINDGLWREIEQGLLTKEQLHQTRWNKIFAEQGIAFDGVVFEKKLFKISGTKRCFRSKERTHCCNTYQGKYTVCAVTNGPYEQQQKRLRLQTCFPF